MHPEKEFFLKKSYIYYITFNYYTILFNPIKHYAFSHIFVFDCNYYFNLPLKKFCESLKDLPEDQVSSLKLRRNEVTGEIETKCFLERMDEYLKVSSTDLICADCCMADKKNIICAYDIDDIYDIHKKTA